MKKTKLQNPVWIYYIIIFSLLLSSCNQTQRSGTSEPSIASNDSSSMTVVSEAADAADIESSTDEELSTSIFPHPFDDSAVIEEYRLVSDRAAVTPDGIFIIDPRYDLHFINGAKSEKLAENVSGIVGITSEWLYCTISSNPNLLYREPEINTLVRISLTDDNTEELLDSISCVIYDPVSNMVYYCKISEPIELYAFDVATGQHTLMFTDEGVWDTSLTNELNYARYGWFDSQSDGTFILTLAYPYPAEIPYPRDLRIDGLEIIADSEDIPMETESSFYMEQNKYYATYKGSLHTNRLVQIRYGADKKLVLEVAGNPNESFTLFYEQNGEREQIAQVGSSRTYHFNIYFFAYCYDRVYYWGQEYDSSNHRYRNMSGNIFNLISKETTTSSLENVRAIFVANDKLYAYLATEDENYHNLYQLVELNKDAEIINTIYEEKGNFEEGLGAQGVQAVQIDDYIVFMTYFWDEDVLSFCWCYNTKTGESVSIEM